MTHSRKLKPAQRLIVALDVATPLEAHRLFEALRPVVTTFKFGYWLLFDPGLYSLQREMRKHQCQFFLDAKLNDIPETVRHGVASAARNGAAFITVHNDAAMLEAAMEGKGGSELNVMAVTALTSQTVAGSRNQFRAGVMNALVTGCDGMIMSASDLNDAIWDEIVIGDMLIATPGVRLPGNLVHDHGRTGTPQQAIRDGADYIIVGRPIIHAADPRQAAENVIAQLSDGTERAVSQDDQPDPNANENVAAATIETALPDSQAG